MPNVDLWQKDLEGVREMIKILELIEEIISQVEQQKNINDSLISNKHHGKAKTQKKR